MRITFIIILIIGLSSCEEGLFGPDNEEVNKSLNESLILGSWSDSEHNDSLVTLERFDKLPSDQYGITFLEDGSLVENKNAGWCGTPPIAYANFSGSWELLEDSILSLETSYWGGWMFLEMKIISVDKSQFTYYLLDSGHIEEE